MVLEEGEDRDDAAGRDVDGQLVLPDGEPIMLLECAFIQCLDMHTVGCIWADTT